MRLVPDRWEDQVIISGIGISRVGRKTGIPDLDLTLEASMAAIADAGLTPGGHRWRRPRSARRRLPLRGQALGIDASWSGGLGSMGGLLSPVFGAGQAIAAGEARHVLVYRTVQMMGGSVAPSDAPPPMDGEQASDLLQVMGDMLDAADLSRLRSTALALDARQAPHGALRHDTRAARLAGDQQPEERGAQRARRVPRSPHHGRLPVVSTVSEPFHLLDCDVPIDGSIAHGALDRRRTQTTRRTPRCGSTPVGGAPGVKGGWWYRDDYPNQASTDASAMLWSRSELDPS